MDFIELFKALADENRLRIIRLLLNGSFNVAEIHFVIGGKQSNVSHHLKVLQNNNIVSSNKEGLQVYYRLSEFCDNKMLSNIINAIKENRSDIRYNDDDLTKINMILIDRKNLAEDYFNKIGDKIDALQDEEFHDIYSVEKITEPLKDSKVILDVGCGTGKNMKNLSKQCDKVIGIDISQKMLQLSDHFCKNNNINHELVYGDFLSMPLANASIDSVFVNMVLHHISLPNLAIKEAARILTKKGKLLLADLLPHNDNKMRDKHADLWLGFDEQYLDGIFVDNGMKIINKSYYSSDLSDKKVIVLYAEKI